MADVNFDWRSFLVRWSEEWADACGADTSCGEQDQEARRARWLGFAPASGVRIAALEEQLGRRLPPSYRAFLEVSDGWRHAGGFVWLLAGTEQARWYEDAAGLGEAYLEDLDEDSPPEQVMLAGMWERALQLDAESDITHVLLDPADVDGDGEWAVYYYEGWGGEHPRRYASFQEFMEAMYRQFHSLTAHRRGAAFDNATTRTLDATIEEARLEALRGQYERAGTMLAEAETYGRPRATGLRDQIRRLLGQTYMVYFGHLTADPLYAPEVLPVLAAEHVRHHRHDDSTWAFHLRGAPDAVRKAGDEILRQVREGTFRYTTGGPFGQAVDEAREQARWGDTDTAWHTLRAALPAWQPLGPDQLVPLGLLADPLLGPLLTPQLGRELLATPRGSHMGDVPAPAADLDPPGMAWLTETDRGNFLVAYRFVLVEGVDPAELPARIGADGTAGLHEPMLLWEAHTRLRSNREVSTWDDPALAAVGRAGPGWSFAFEPRPGQHFNEQRFISPGQPASHGTRAVVVWSEPARGHGDLGLFHLSVAEDGQEKYAFTVHGTTIRRSGTIPATLDPDRFIPQTPDEPVSGRLGERRALEAIAAEFQVRLPRFALTHGRLHTFTTRSWTRPPGPGETYTVIRFGPLGNGGQGPSAP